MDQKAPAFSAVISVFCGLLSFFVFSFFVREGEGSFFSWDSAPGGILSCVVLTVDESSSDRGIRQSLAGLGLGEFISESSQEIPVDDFGELKMIPLDSFRDKVETFDPRNDGYAERLRAFFVRYGKRFFFLPLKSRAGIRSGKLEKQVASLLGDIPFSFTVLENKDPFMFRFIVFALSCAAALRLSRSKRLFVYGFPVLLSFFFCGGSAFVFAALLSGIWELLREPLGELSAAYSGERWKYDYAGAGLAGFLERLRPFRANIVLAAVFLFFFFVLSALGEISFIPLAVSCFLFFFLYFLVFRIEIKNARESPHRLFFPVPLFPVRAKTFSFFPFLLPFAAGALLTVVFPVLFPVFSGLRENEINAELRYDAGLSAEDYYRHIDFQRSFSYRPLHQNDNRETAPLKQEGYFRYHLGEDGLISDNTCYFEKNGDIPSFPLEKLMGFLVQYYRRDRDGEVPGPSLGRVAAAEKFAERISAALILLFCAVDLPRPARYRKRQ